MQKGALGDVILTTALLDDLHRAFPEAAIDFGVGKAAAPLLEHHPLISERVIVDAEPAWRLAPAIRARRYDWVVDVQSSARTAILTWCSGAAVRIGWDARVRGAAYTHRLARDGAPEYVVIERRRLLALANITTGDTAPRLVLSAAERAEGERAMRTAGAPPERPRVGLVLTSAEASRNWPLAHFAALIPLLRAEGLTPVVLYGPGDVAPVARLQGLVPDVIALNLRVRALLGALAACRLLVSGDTGPAHMASALGVPRVTIYGPTSPVLYSAGGPGVVELASANPPIRKMRERKELLAGRDDYTADVTPARVVEAVRSLIRP